jgi:hypothetical protein
VSPGPRRCSSPADGAADEPLGSSTAQEGVGRRGPWCVALRQARPKGWDSDTGVRDPSNNSSSCPEPDQCREDFTIETETICNLASCRYSGAGLRIVRKRDGFGRQPPRGECSSDRTSAMDVWPVSGPRTIRVSTASRCQPDRVAALAPGSYKLLICMGLPRPKEPPDGTYDKRNRTKREGVASADGVTRQGRRNER